ncbi:MAG: hypothetical protein V2A59_03345 [Candidatus Omnitrophota bacterium]
MGVIDIKPKLADIKAKIQNLTIGFKKEEKVILLQALDESTHIHYHTEIGLSNEDILKLSSQEVGDLVKHQALLSIKSALHDKPEQMTKYLGMYTATALTIGASSISASAIVVNLGSSPMPSGEFVEQLPGAIETSIQSETIPVKDIAWLEIKDTD